MMKHIKRMIGTIYISLYSVFFFCGDTIKKNTMYLSCYLYFHTNLSFYLSTYVHIIYFISFHFVLNFLSFLLSLSLTIYLSFCLYLFYYLSFFLSLSLSLSIFHITVQYSRSYTVRSK